MCTQTSAIHQQYIFVGSNVFEATFDHDGGGGFVQRRQMVRIMSKQFVGEDDEHKYKYTNAEIQLHKYEYTNRSMQRQQMIGINHPRMNVPSWC